MGSINLVKQVPTKLLKNQSDESGNVSIFFKINGQLRNVIIKDRSVKVEKIENAKADANDAEQIGAPCKDYALAFL